MGNTNTLPRLTEQRIFEHGPGIVGWQYKYWNEHPIQHSGIATGIEFYIQISGTWHSGRDNGAPLITLDQPRISLPGEHLHDYFGHEGGKHKSRNVGFIIYPNELGLSQELIYERPLFIDRRRLCELGRAYDDGITRGFPLSEYEIKDTLVQFIQSELKVRPPNSLEIARNEIDVNLRSELYIKHLAEAAEMQPRSFARAFSRKFGVSPVRYRYLQRLNTLAKMLWCEPERSITALGQEVGFNDRAYLFRAFQAQFKSTPNEYRQRRLASANHG